MDKLKEKWNKIPKKVKIAGAVLIALALWLTMVQNGTPPVHFNN